MLGAGRFLSGGAFDGDALALFAAMANQPSIARQVIMNQLIVDLKAAGLWTKFDILTVPGLFESGNTSAQALINWKLNTFTLVPTNVTFTQNRGVTANAAAGDGVQVQSPGPVNTPLNTLVQFQLNSAHISVWSNNGTGVNSALGVNGANLGQLSLTPGNTFIAGLNAAGTSSLSSPGTPLGSRIASRTASNLVTGYIAGVSSATPATASTVVSGSPLVLLRSGTSPYLNRVPAMSVGAGLSSTEAADLYTALNTALTAVGAQ